MNKTGIIIAREFNERVRKKSFIITTVLMPVLMIALMAAPTLMMIFAKGETKTLLVVDDSGVIDIKEGRHPVVERMLKDDLFVPNDTRMDGGADRLSIITGPNMAGKSTYMRQTALIVLMAQMGSFVPASYARIGIVDRIFTRVGASDDLASGQSTFMVEMSETSLILNNATERS